VGAMTEEKGKVKIEKFNGVDFAFARCKLMIICIRKSCINHSLKKQTRGHER